jgi:hypothetical protein
VKSSPRPAWKSRLGFGLGYVQDIVCSDIRVDCVVDDIFGLPVDIVRWTNMRAKRSEAFSQSNHALRPFGSDIAFPRSILNQNDQVKTTKVKCFVYPIVYLCTTRPTNNDRVPYKAITTINNPIYFNEIRY